MGGEKRGEKHGFLVAWQIPSQPSKACPLIPGDLHVVSQRLHMGQSRPQRCHAAYYTALLTLCMCAPMCAPNARPAHTNPSGLEMGRQFCRCSGVSSNNQPWVDSLLKSCRAALSAQIWTLMPLMRMSADAKWIVSVQVESSFICIAAEHQQSAASQGFPYQVGKWVNGLHEM